MYKPILLALLLVSTLAFTINQQQIVSQTVDTQLQDINWPFTTCGDGKWDIRKLTLNVSPARNQNYTINTTGIARASIVFTKVVLGAKLNGVPVHSQTITYTKTYNYGDIVQFEFTNFISPFASPGTYTLSFQFVDNSRNNNGCLSFQFKI